MKPRLLLLVLLAAASLPAAAATQVYSWTDANGTKHFTDSPPPPSVNAQKIKMRGSVTSADEAPPAPAIVADASRPPEGLPPATTAAVPKQMADTPENRAKQCQTARANLEILKGNYPVSAPAGADGRSQILDDTGRKTAVDHANGQVAFYCK